MERLTDFYAKGMMAGPMRWFCRKSGKRKFTEEDIAGMKATAALRAADHNPYSWNMDFYEYPGGSGYEGRFTRCGICTLMQELGSYDLTLALCHPDYTMSETDGATSFVRTYTLASGGPYCDCGYKKCVKKVPLGFLGVLAAQDLNAGGAEQHTGGKHGKSLHGKSLHGRSLLYILQQLDVANRRL